MLAKIKIKEVKKKVKMKRKMKTLRKVFGSRKLCRSGRGKPPGSKRYLKRSPKVKEIAVETLEILNVPDVKKFYNDHSDAHLHAIINFRLAAQDSNLSVCLEPDQLKAYVQRLHDLNYVTTMLKRQWTCWCQVAVELEEEFSDEILDAFDLAMANCRETSDNKVPVSRKLLCQLLEAADLLLQDYNAKLFKAVLLTAFGASMRVGKYTDTGSAVPHNIHDEAVAITKKGIEVKFFSIFSIRRQHTKVWLDITSYHGGSCPKGQEK